MIDYFALALTHGLILLALIRMVGRKELDHDPAFAEPDKTTPSKSDDLASERDA